jgi:hypothetical protein
MDYPPKVLEWCSVTNAKPVSTPLPEGYKPEVNLAALASELQSQFQMVIGLLLYIMLGMHPDIAFAVTKLAQYTANLSQIHYNKAIHICRYLLGTAKYQLIYNSEEGNGLIAFTNLSYGNDVDSRQLHSGFLMQLADGAICWQLHLQKSVVLSVTKAEYMSLSDCTHQAVWLAQVLKELGFEIGAVPVCMDNQGAIFIASNEVIERQSKHIDIRYHYVQELVFDKCVELFYLEGVSNPTDTLTKSLG